MPARLLVVQGVLVDAAGAVDGVALEADPVLGRAGALGARAVGVDAGGGHFGDGAEVRAVGQRDHGEHFFVHKRLWQLCCYCQLSYGFCTWWVLVEFVVLKRAVIQRWKKVLHENGEDWRETMKTEFGKSMDEKKCKRP